MTGEKDDDLLSANQTIRPGITSQFSKESEKIDLAQVFITISVSVHSYSLVVVVQIIPNMEES